MLSSKWWQISLSRNVFKCYGIIEIQINFNENMSNFSLNSVLVDVQQTDLKIVFNSSLLEF